MIYAVLDTETRALLGYIDTNLLTAALVDRHEHDNAEWGIELVEGNARSIAPDEFPSRINTVEDFAAWMRPGTVG